tara:strand:- start:307 stop:1269 length:963 start_codon:yes stop_codon:yes gene_type:complete
MLNKIIVVFPGQGSQIVGMGRDLFKNHHIAKQVFDEVDNTLNEKLSKIIFDGPENELTLTKNTQPAIMTVSMALVRVIEYESKKKIFEFSDTILGHSLGEYSALCSLNALSLKDTTLLLKKRGKAMQDSVKNLKTKMVAVIGLDIDKVEKIIEENMLDTSEICEIANDNCPGQVILSGTEKGVIFMSSILKDNGARSIIDLKVSAPFHCSLMNKASDVMKGCFKEISLKEFESNFISNVTANFENNPKKIKELLIKQVSSRVRWRESIIKSTKKINYIVEIGPGKILSGMNKRINRDYNLFSVSNLDEVNKFLKQFEEIL